MPIPLPNLIQLVDTVLCFTHRFLTDAFHTT